MNVRLNLEERLQRQDLAVPVFVQPNFESLCWRWCEHFCSLIEQAVAMEGNNSCRRWNRLYYHFQLGFNSRLLFGPRLEITEFIGCHAFVLWQRDTRLLLC